MTDAALQLRNISFSYGPRRVLKEVSLEVPPGRIYALVGANGSGKSTLLRIIAGAIPRYTGVMTLAGTCGYVAQTFALYGDLSVQENISFFARCSGLTAGRLKAAEDEVLEGIGLVPVRDQRASQLSHGWKQRLKLAVALCHKPSILLLDEATAGIDPDARNRIWNLLAGYAEAGTTILLATHHTDEAARCDRIAYLNDGALTLSADGGGSV